jgi:3-oxoacid CoA-transferase subunit A
MRKIFPDAAALDGLLQDGMTLAAGGFGLCGIPERLIDDLVAGVQRIIVVMEHASKAGEPSSCPPAPCR